MLVLGIESSCDETAAAVVRDDGRVLSDVVASQIAVHAPYGGVVPELASRAHLVNVVPVIEQALAEVEGGLSAIDAIAVTRGPGLVGALLVGVQAAKAIAFVRDLPLVGVDHLVGHLFAVYLRRGEGDAPPPELPFVALLVSGGHTAIYEVAAHDRVRIVGQTRDDAAGEAFDKAAKLLGLPYPGGPSIEAAARAGDPSRHPLPRPLLAANTPPDDPDYYDFSYSGLKTALRNRLRAVGDGPLADREVPHLAAAFQEAAIEVLVAKTQRATRQVGCERVVLGGGVANSRMLRERLATALPRGELFFPSPRLATDNAAMIARAARFRFERGETATLDLTARADLPFPGLIRRPTGPA